MTGVAQGVALLGISWYTGCHLRFSLTESLMSGLAVGVLFIASLAGEGTIAGVYQHSPADSASLPSPPAAVLSGVVVEGEDLLYEVRWSVFKLGTIHFKTLKTIREDSTELYSAVAFMDSYAGIPFVDLHALTYTQMDSTFNSRGAQSLEKKKNRWWVLHYIFDIPTGRVFVEESWQEDLTVPPATRRIIDTLSVDMDHIEDSFSLAFFARAYVHTHQTVALPLIVNGKIGLVHLTFTGKPTIQEIDAVDYPVRVVPVEGHLDVEGLFGMSGDFEGWFSDDNASVPIMAKLNVILGSITVEMKGWSRKGWIPPRE